MDDSSSTAAAAIAATSTDAIAAPSASSSSEPTQRGPALAAPRSDLRSDLQWMQAQASNLATAAAAAAAAASPSSGLAALADTFFEIDEFVAAHAPTMAAPAQPHTSRSRIQQLQSQEPQTKASPDAPADAQRLELNALFDAWRLQPSSSPLPAAPGQVLHPAALASLSRSVRSQLAAHFLERLATAGFDAVLHAELTNILAQILPPPPQADGGPSLSAAQSQLCCSLSRQLHSHILPSISSFEWSRKRDLPPILSKPITRPSPAIFLLQSFLRGACIDAHGSLSPALARPVLLCLLTELSESCTEIYTSLGTSVSRFHSRQLFVDVASLFAVVRSVERAMEVDKPAVQLQSYQASIEQQQICRIHSALLELACALVITHPTLLPLSSFPALLAGWEHIWTAARSAGSPASSSSVAETTSAIAVLLGKQVGMLWHCEAASFAAPAASASPSAAAAPPPSFLSSFFSMPRLQLAGSSDAAATAAAAGIAPDTHWVSQKLDLGAGCVSPVEMLSAPIVIAAIPPSRLLRLVQMRHEMREADFPELAADEEAMAGQLREMCTRLSSVTSSF